MQIYKITNKLNNKIYIGKTIHTAESRFKEHILSARNSSSNTHLYRAMRKYGVDNFTVEVVECVDTIELLAEREIYWIAEFDSTNPCVGYNMTRGGDGGDSYRYATEEEKARRSALMSEK